MLLRLFLYALLLILTAAVAYGVSGGSALWVLCAVMGASLITYGALSLYALRLSHALRPDAPHDIAPSLVGVYRDIWERIERKTRKQQQKTQAASAQLQELLYAMQQSPVGVVLLDGDNRIEWMNPLAAAHLGMDPQRDRAQIITNLLRHPDFSAYIHRSHHDAQQEIVIDGQMNNSKIAVQLHDYARRNRRGQQRLLLSRDVSTLIQAEAMRRDFVANVSHEIATPLTVLSGFLETLTNIPLDAEQGRTVLKMMGEQTSRMNSLLKDLLTLARLESTTQPNGQHRIRISALMEQGLADALQWTQTLGTKHTLAVKNLATDATLLGAPHELQSALGNLLQNALRYSLEGTVITVRWEVDTAGQGVLSVIDQGEGIADEHLGRLTERFYRVDSSRSRASGGTGLGLAIVKHIALRHDGQLRISSALGQGSCFSLVFPSHRMEMNEVAKADADAAGDESLPIQLKQ